MHSSPSMSPWLLTNWLRYTCTWKIYRLNRYLTEIYSTSLWHFSASFIFSIVWPDEFHTLNVGLTLNQHYTCFNGGPTLKQHISTEYCRTPLDFVGHRFRDVWCVKTVAFTHGCRIKERNIECYMYILNYFWQYSVYALLCDRLQWKICPQMSLVMFSVMLMFLRFTVINYMLWVFI